MVSGLRHDDGGEPCHVSRQRQLSLRRARGRTAKSGLTPPRCAPCLHGPPWGWGVPAAGNPAHRIEVPQHRLRRGLAQRPAIRRETGAGLSRRRKPQLKRSAKVAPVSRLMGRASNGPTGKGAPSFSCQAGSSRDRSGRPFVQNGKRRRLTLGLSGVFAPPGHPRVNRGPNIPATGSLRFASQQVADEPALPGGQGWPHRQISQHGNR